MKTIRWLLVVAALVGQAHAAAKIHVVALGRWSSVKLVSEGSSTKNELKVRPLLVDGKVREFTTGAIHDITERVFVVQRAYKLNDLLPGESGGARWRWEIGGWMLVDRTSGKVQMLSLPEFDPYTSQVSWFRDYVAYCGVAEETQKLFMIVAQAGKRKPLLKQVLTGGGAQSNACEAPAWERDPARVTFDPSGEQKVVFTVKTHSLEWVANDEEADD